jgi:hypothetical protein
VYAARFPAIHNTCKNLFLAFIHDSAQIAASVGIVECCDDFLVDLLQEWGICIGRILKLGLYMDETKILKINWEFPRARIV